MLLLWKLLPVLLLLAPAILHSRKASWKDWPAAASSYTPCSKLLLLLPPFLLLLLQLPGCGSSQLQEPPNIATLALPCSVQTLELPACLLPALSDILQQLVAAGTTCPFVLMLGVLLSGCSTDTALVPALLPQLLLLLLWLRLPALGPDVVMVLAGGFGFLPSTGCCSAGLVVRLAATAPGPGLAS
jgi:hypothetical protein